MRGKLTSQNSSGTGKVVTPILQVGTLSDKEVEDFTQGHAGNL